MIQKQQQYKRTHPRANFDWPVIVLSEQGTIQGKIKDISRGGALIRVNTRIEKGESIRMAIEIPEFDDVISVKGEVVRVSSMADKHDASLYGLGVRFTEISEEDLRYFTGNLAPEWQDGYEEPEVPVKTRLNLWKISSAALAALFILVLALFLLPEDEEKVPAMTPSQLTTINDKLRQLEAQTQHISPDENNITQLEQQIRSIEEKVAEIEKRIAEDTDKTILLAEPLQTIEEKPAEIPIRVEAEPVEVPIQENVGLLLPTKKKVSLNIARQQTVTGYHLVQQGDTLYSISKKYGLTIDQLRSLNSLAPQTKIYPNQKLLVKSQPAVQ